MEGKWLEVAKRGVPPKPKPKGASSGAGKGSMPTPKTKARPVEIRGPRGPTSQGAGGAIWTQAMQYPPLSPSLVLGVYGPFVLGIFSRVAYASCCMLATPH